MSNVVSVSVTNTPYNITAVDTGSTFVMTDTCDVDVTMTQDVIAAEVVQQDAYIITAGAMGLQGPAGAGEEEVLASQVDFQDSGNTIYRGEAQPGTATSAASWRIRKLTINAEGDVSTLWADGDSNMDNVWDNRYSLSYS